MRTQRKNRHSIVNPLQISISPLHPFVQRPSHCQGAYCPKIPINLVGLLTARQLCWCRNLCLFGFISFSSASFLWPIQHLTGRAKNVFPALFPFQTLQRFNIYFFHSGDWNLYQRISEVWMSFRQSCRTKINAPICTKISVWKMYSLMYL